MTEYIITTERLGLRNWHTSDLAVFTEMSQDPEVMEFFPNLLTEEDCIGFIKRMQNHFQKFGFCYFAVDILETGKFIGFTGMLNQTYESHFTPCVDIGWRLKRSAWGKGYATEAAKSCLNFAINNLNLKKVYSLASVPNINSISIMKKIGMEYHSTFQHPALLNNDFLKDCVVYHKQIKSN